jgi:membrane protein YqaA with SNARE-associated domain
MTPDDVILLCGFCAIIGGVLGYGLGYLRGEAKGWRDSK